ncbi:ATPase, partial [bacterium]|nr:ATPase [bacterium]
MQNPFIVGRQFRPESFIDREKETAFIVDEISQKGNLVVFGSRRLGKTWLIEKSLHELMKTDRYHC